MSILTRQIGRTDYIIDQMIITIQRKSTIKEDKFLNFIDYSIAEQNLVVTMKSLNFAKHLMNSQLLKQMILKLPIESLIYHRTTYQSRNLQIMVR